MKDKGYRFLAAFTLICVLFSMLAVFFLLPGGAESPDTGKMVSGPRIIMLAALPFIPIFLFSQKGSGKILCTIMTVLIEAYASIIILSGLGAPTPDYPAISHIVLSLLLVAESVHLGTNRKRESPTAINFKWIDDYGQWLGIQKKGSVMAAVLSAVEITNTVLFISGLYSFKASAVIAAVATYLAVLAVFRLAKPSQNRES